MGISNLYGASIGQDPSIPQDAASSRRAGIDPLIRQSTGSAPNIGTATLVAGTVTVNTQAVQAGSIIFLSFKTLGGTTGTLSVGVVTPNVSFVINSSNVADTGTVNWQIFQGQ